MRRCDNERNREKGSVEHGELGKDIDSGVSCIYDDDDDRGPDWRVSGSAHKSEWIEVCPVSHVVDIIGECLGSVRFSKQVQNATCGYGCFSKYDICHLASFKMTSDSIYPD